MSQSNRLPWRSVWLPRAVTAVALIVGLPLFLRSPPWCDITLYQMAARNLLNGGVHYRDIFDTNLPGFVWMLTAITWVCGFSVVAVRTFDLLIVLGVVLLIDRLAKWGGATPVGRWWALAGAAVFYPFTVEMAHAQRDTWMALPGLAAVALRVRRGIGAAAGLSPFRLSLLEGALWGAGLWVKPHLLLMALGVWLVSAWRLAADRPRPWPAAGADLLGNLAGGLAVGLAGVSWLYFTGAWPHFIDVFTRWNPGYMTLVRAEFHWRVGQQLNWFAPWSLGLVLTAPLALLAVIDMAPWWGRARAGAHPERAGAVGRWLPWFLWDRQASADARFARGVLGWLYLIWVAQAFFLQRGFQYAHVPETLLMIGIWAAHRWAWVPVALMWLTITSGIWIIAERDSGTREWLAGLEPVTREQYVPCHAAAKWERTKLWGQCWRTDLTPRERYELWDQLRQYPPHEAVVSWVEIAEVADYLRSQGVGDRDVIAWFDSPHVVYLMLDIDPGMRFMHVHTAASIGPDEDGETGAVKVLRELGPAKARAAFVISDLEWIALHAGGDEQLRANFLGPPHDPAGGDLMPTHTPFRTYYRSEFPFYLPTVFRSSKDTPGDQRGRYIIHRIRGPGRQPWPVTSSP